MSNIDVNINQEYIPKVLIVDDVKYNIQIIANILSTLNYDIFFAEDGHAALRLANERDIDIILLDVMMPGFDGFDVCRKLRNSSKTKHIPVVFITAKTGSNDIIEGFKAGGHDYITKPFRKHELIARVQTHVKLSIQSKQLAKTNILLEEKIEERTRELKNANEQLLVLDEAKNDFLTLINHELRTPLNSISGFCQLLEKKTKNTELNKYVINISKANNELLRIINMSLLFTSIKAEKYDVLNTKTNINDFLQLLISSTEDRDELAHITIKSVQKDDILFITDINLLHKATELLIENIALQTKEKCKVTLHAEKTDKQIVIFVNSNGYTYTNLTKQSMAVLFTTDNVNHHKQGTGLELATVKLIVNVLKGKIELNNLNSEQGQVKLTFKAE